MADKHNIFPGSDEKNYIDQIENTYRGYIDAARQLGMYQTAEQLEWFLNKNGKTKNISREDARNKLFIRDGEALNRKRFSDSFINPKSKEINQKIKNLKEGEYIKLNDRWDYELGLKSAWKNFDPSRSHILSGRFDDAFSVGATKLRSNGNFEARRKGGKLYVDGIIQNDWDDVYDFDPKTIFGAGASVLQEHQRAKIYDTGASWRQRMNGTVDYYKDGLSNPRFTWQDMDN